MLYVLILAIALACVSCDAFGFRARTKEDSGALDLSRRQWGYYGYPYYGTIAIIVVGRRRRSVEGERFKVVIKADPCVFEIYDANRDDVITMDELEAIFGEGEKTKELGKALDDSGDGQVDKDEFKEDMHKYVEGC
ncbi:hypothetical protein DPMN_137281 [Dreissena polymorpha]|uniref:EF-hand domain-containing protein n=1 Tax=Dreissena polymorpha TaxID=45954 RepID=A0A9D4G2B7_DREPO|nr:hypothetical protein DPMN_137281 [Dreissena polymorpha]